MGTGVQLDCGDENCGVRKGDGTKFVVLLRNVGLGGERCLTSLC